MRRVVWSEYISLDGVVEEPGQWSIPYFSDDLSQYKYDELFASDALLLGRITYEGFAAAWPTMEVRMLVHRIAVGTGKRLFDHLSEPVSMRLVGTRSFDSGVVALTYHQAD